MSSDEIDEISDVNISWLPFPFELFCSKGFFILKGRDEMRKRFVKGKKFMAAAVAVLSVTLLFSACGQPSGSQTDSTNQIYKIGITQYADHPSLDNCRQGFIQGLENQGFVQGKNIDIEFKAAQGDNAMATQIAQNFASTKDLVCGIATPSAQSLYAACLEKNIPVIFNAISDPVEAKLAVSDSQAMKGISGISDRLPVEDQLKLIRQILPEAKKIGIIYSNNEANSVSTLRTYQELAPQYGFEIIERGIAKQAEVPQAADYLLSQVDCISNMTDNTVVSALGVVLEKANQKNIPVFGSEEEQVKNGCIASAGIDYIALGERAGEMAAKVLNGTDISTLPYETLQESKLTVNLAAAESLGITIPDEVKAAAQAV